MTTNITFRQATQTPPGSTTTKNAPLTNAELDGNWASVVAAIATVNTALSNYALASSLSSYALLSGCTFTGTVNGITSAMVGLGNVNNTSDAAKPVSTATQTALNLKQDTLVSNSNIKTVGGVSLLGSGDVPITTAGATIFLANNFGAL